MSKPVISIIMGSQSDLEIVKEAMNLLKECKVDFEVKVLAAHRAGITHILIPEENAKDIQDIPAMILKVVKIETVEHLDQVLRKALVLDHPERFLMKQEADLSPATLYPSEPSISPQPAPEIVTH